MSLKFCHKLSDECSEKKAGRTLDTNFKDHKLGLLQRFYWMVTGYRRRGHKKVFMVRKHHPWRNSRYTRQRRALRGIGARDRILFTGHREVKTGRLALMCIDLEQNRDGQEHWTRSCFLYIANTITIYWLCAPCPPASSTEPRTHVRPKWKLTSFNCQGCKVKDPDGPLQCFVDLG